MANAYFYSSTAVQTALTGSISAGATAVQVGDTTGWPVSYPYVVAFDYGVTGEELVKVTANSAGNLTVVRGFNGTSATSHSLGATARHVYCANDATDFRTHEAAVSAVHGVAGTIVGTSDSQTLTNKTYNGGVLSGTWSGTVAGTPTFSGAVILSGTPSISNGAALAGTFTGSPTFSGNPTFSGSVTHSGGGSFAGTYTGTPTFSGAVVFSGSPTFTGNPGVVVPIASAASVGIRVTGAASQTGNLLEIRDNTPAIVTRITSQGRLEVLPNASGVGLVSLLVNAPSAQSVDLQDWSVNGSVLASVDKSGNFNAANFNGGAWTAFTPTWTAATTNPTLGNGTLTGYYVQQGKLVSGYVSLVIGSTTTLGTGAWRFALPVTASSNALAIATQIGQATANPGAVATTRSTGEVLLQSTSLAQIIASSSHVNGTATTNSGLYSGTTPDAWVSTGSLNFNFTYEAA